jgi:Tfp pilus assembly protein PilF
MVPTSDEPSALLERLRQALDRNPDDRTALLSLARLCRRLGDASAAAAVLDRLLELHPDDPAVLIERIYLLRRQDRFDEALAVADRLVAAPPDRALAWVTRGTLLHRLERFEAAVASYRHALSLEPGFAPAQFSLGFTLLLLGQWREGLAAFEARRRLPIRVPPPLDLPDWTGTEPPGCRILVWNDQGFGDAIQYLRLVPALVRGGYRPILRLPGELVRLARSLSPEIPVLDPSDADPPVERQIPLGSLPYCLGLTTPDGSWDGAYLTAPVGRRLRDRPGLKVGLVWAGSASHDNDARRSIAIAALAPLFDLPGIAWHSLQIGPRAADLAGLPIEIEDLGADIGDFADTASYLMQLDLLISVDTSIVHLAGALGCPVWMLAARPADWRWLAEGETTGWYPSVRLFRQRERGQWPPAVAAVKSALAALADAPIIDVLVSSGPRAMRASGR